MRKIKPLDFSEDFIDNKLESFPFFPLRFICYILSISAMCAVIIALSLQKYGLIFSGVIIFIATFPIAIIQKRITVDLEGNKYRGYSSFWGIKKGAWKSFKGFTIITITHSTQQQRLGSRFGVNSIDIESDVFYLNLKKDNYNKLTIAAGNYKSMFKKALQLAHRYKVGIMDCSEKPNKKYEYKEIEEKYRDKTI